MVNKESPKVSNEQETYDSKSPSIETAGEKKVIHISDDELPFPTKTKRRRLMKNGSVVHNNVVNLISSDEENTIPNKEVAYAKSPKYEKTEFDDAAPITFSRSTNNMTTRSKPNKYAIIDKDTDEDIDNNNSIHYVSTDDTTDIQYTNNFIDEEAGIDLDDSQPVSYEDTDDVDDMDGFIDDDDATDDEYSDDDF